MRVEEARKKVKEAGGSWEVFENWMVGQTIGVYDDGTPNIYDWDVDRFIRYKCDPDNEPLEEWD